MPLSDLQIECPQPTAANTAVRCRHCIHFRDVPHYKINGALTVCSSPNIARAPNQTPCPHYAANTSAYRRLSLNARRALGELLAEIGADASVTRGKKIDHVRDAAAIADFSALLRAVHDIHRAGFTPGGSYTVEGLTEPGTLLALNAGRAVVSVAGVPYTVSSSKLTPHEEE